MTVEVEIDGGRPRVVSVGPGGTSGELTVTVDGRTYAVDVAQAGDGVVSVILLDRGHQSCTATVLAGSGSGELLVRLADGITRRVVLNGRRAPSRSTGRTPDGEQRIVAPIPGRVVKVLVAVGDQVALGQPLVVVEAMKMENELRSPKAGRVKEIAATGGLSVEAGRLLMVVE